MKALMNAKITNPLKNKIRILIIDDHPVVRYGLMAAIGCQPDMSIIAAVDNVEQAVPLCRANLPDVSLLGFSMPNMFADRIMSRLRSVNVTSPILLLSTDDVGDELFRALDVGATGCVFRTAELEEVLDGIRIIYSGAVWLSAEVVARWRAYRSGVRLASDELDCLRLLAAGKSNPQIAAELGWSEQQVRDRMRWIRSKLGAKNETHMLVTALRRGIVSLG
jgi:DNA-binding NarL/FixJ family response regulator